MTQNEKVLRHMEEFGGITPMEAMQKYGIMRLASRINDIKREGIPVRREIVKTKNRFGETVHYARYSLIGGERNESVVEKPNGTCRSHAQENCG